MSDQVFEQHVDEHGNVFVRISQDVVVLTREDADRVKARLDQLNAENARLRELVRDVWHLFTEHGAVHPYDLPKVDAVRDGLRELGVEVD